MHLTQDEWERGPRLPQGQDLGGALQCGGKASLERIPGVTRKTPHSFVNRNVNDDAEANYADEWKGCLAIQDDDTRREALNHSEGEWVVGNVHTHGIKGVWVAVQALHRRGLPPDQPNAPRPLHRRDGVALRQPQQPTRLPGQRQAHRHERSATLPRVGRPEGRLFSVSGSRSKLPGPA